MENDDPVDRLVFAMDEARRRNQPRRYPPERARGDDPPQNVGEGDPRDWFSLDDLLNGDLNGDPEGNGRRGLHAALIRVRRSAMNGLEGRIVQPAPNGQGDEEGNGGGDPRNEWGAPLPRNLRNPLIDPPNGDPEGNGRARRQNEASRWVGPPRNISVNGRRFPFPLSRNLLDALGNAERNGQPNRRGAPRPQNVGLPGARPRTRFDAPPTILRVSNRVCPFRFPKLAHYRVNVEDGLEIMASTDRDFDHTELFLRRVTACVGWAVHGLVFEFVNGKRMGLILEGCGEYYTQTLADDVMNGRGGVGWTDIQYGDYIVGMHGDRIGNRASHRWFCHTMTLEFASGKSIRYESTHEAWRGEPFSYTIPQPCLVYRITFSHAQEEDMRGLRTSIHLPISQALRSDMKDLPQKYEQAVEEILRITRQIDLNRSLNELKPLGDDLWGIVLGMINVYEISVSP